MSIKLGRLQELINEITGIATGMPATGNVANTAPQGTGITSTGPKPLTTPVPPKPKTPQEIDAMAQIVKNAGLNPTQLNQVILKAK